jgi:hypothetical protein
MAIGISDDIPTIDDHQIISGALFDFMGFLTSRPEEITLSSHHEPHDLLKAFAEWAEERNLNTEHALVQDWRGAI